MILLTLLFDAQAAPNRVAATYDLGVDLSEATLSVDGRWLGLIESDSGELRVFDTWTWAEDTLDAAPCSGPSGLAAWETEDGDQRFYVGCSDGTIVGVTVSDDGISSDSTGIAVADEGVIVGLLPIDTAIYVAEDPGDGAAISLHEVYPDDETVDSDTSAWPATLAYAGYADMVWTGSVLIVVHGDDNVSKVDLSSGSSTANEESLSSAACADAWVTSNGAVLAACGGAGVLRYQASLNDWEISLDDEDGLDEPTALTVDEYSSGDEVLIVADSGTAYVFPYSTSSGYPDDDLQDDIDLDGAVLTRLTTTAGYALGVTDAGGLVVMTGAPWVVVDAPEPTEAAEGDTVTLSFGADMDGDWTLLLGDEDGLELDSGELVAGEIQTVTLTVTDDYAEGSNALRVEVSGADGTGHDVAILDVDNPPSKVKLTDNDVGFGDESATLTIPGIDDEDLEEYQVYLSITEFASGDYATGGPTFDGDDALGSDLYDATTGLLLPVAGEPGEDVSLTLSPLTNGQTYYVAVRAIDQGGQEGPMSKVVSVVPQETYSVSERTKERGGFCGVATPASALGAALAMGLLALRRRAAPIAAATLLVGGVAHAEGNFAEGARPKSNFQVRVGTLKFADSNPIEDQFGGPHNYLMLEGGPSFLGIAELNLGTGFWTEGGNTWGEDGTLSTTQIDRFLVMPLTLSGTLRLDLIKEQPIVPIASIGGDYWIWRERWDDGSGDKAQLGGGKPGWHYTLGAQVLLDVFEQRQASALEARTGIRDSYLAGEYRVQTVTDGQGVDFSASTISVGLKFHY